jgi:hypothetical protein
VGAFSVWAGGKEQAPAIDAEATGDRVEKVDTETTRPTTYGMPSRGEGIKTMEVEGPIRQYSAGERDFAGANLSGANLSGANVTDKQLAQVPQRRNPCPTARNTNEQSGLPWLLAPTVGDWNYDRQPRSVGGRATR